MSAATKIIRVNLDGQGNAVLSFLCNPVAEDPASPQDSQLWYNLAEGKLKARINGVTQVIAGGNEAASTAQLLSLDTTSLAHGSSSTVSMFTLPANAVVEYVAVIVDTAFDGTPSMSVGLSGSASKYLASTQVDMAATAKTIFRVHPGEPASVSTEALEIAYTAGAATTGAARIVVAYAVPD
jgi:hypothetical protein